MAFLDDDLDDFLDDDLAVPIESAGIFGKAIPDRESIIDIDGEIVAVNNMPIVRTDLFGLLKIGDQVVLDGLLYEVIHDPMKFDDGVFCRIPLRGPVDLPLPPSIIGVPLATTVGIPLVALPEA